MPLFSIFTPTHNPKWLLDCWESLACQTLQDFEWLLLPNGPKFTIPDEIRRHPQVKILPHRGRSRAIGALKRQCCAEASGRLFLELDHDDILVHDCLEEVATTAELTPGGFYYSNFCTFNEEDGTSITYNPAMGWTTRPFNLQGFALTETISFPVTARSLCEILYAPNHVRCWSREAYSRTGGHAPDREICDDHDLLCRTYLAGIPMRHINKCLYLYRTHRGTDAQSSIDRSRAIEVAQNEIRRLRLPGLIQQWLYREGLAELPHRDWRMLRSHGTGRLGMIRLQDLQLMDGDELISCLNECYRVLVAGGWLTLRVPLNQESPFDKSHWNQDSINYIVAKNLAPRGLRARFQLVQSDVEIDPASGASYLHATLCSLHSPNQPGPKWI